MLNSIFRLVFCALFVIETQQTSPVWDVVTSCSIPNEYEAGVCLHPVNCVAFQEINDVNSIGNISRSSFVRQLQCLGSEEGKICCPRRGSYADPWFNLASLKRKVRPKISSIANRVSAGLPCGDPGYDTYVNNGEIAKIDDFPWMALLLYDKAMNPVSPGCGGALISKTFVITAAHCLTGQILQKKGSLKFVRVGEYDLLNNPDCTVEGEYADCNDGFIDVKPKRMIVHPDYKAGTVNQHHDIGLVELDDAVEYTAFIRHICLPDPSNEKISKEFSVCGWGRTDFFKSSGKTNIPSPIKLKTTLPYVDHGKCSEIYQTQRLQLIKGQICAGGSNTRDTCSGDSGSPLMHLDMRKQAWVLSGLVSTGPQNCGTVGKPGIYTNVNQYVQWIKANAHL